MAFGSGIDSTAAQVGAEFSVIPTQGDAISFVPRVDENIIEILKANDANVSDYVKDMSRTGMSQTTARQRQAVINKAIEEPEYGQRIIREYSSGSNTNIFSRLFGRAAGRDDAIRLAYREALPKIGYGAIAAGALALGYYGFKKKKENDLYNETIDQQPYEKTNFVSQRNRNISPIVSPMSTRRDPLVTAGVVGNLDRNKIGHTSMGPNKYNHLYG